MSKTSKVLHQVTGLRGGLSLLGVMVLVALCSAAALFAYPDTTGNGAVQMDGNIPNNSGDGPVTSTDWGPGTAGAGICHTGPGGAIQATAPRPTNIDTSDCIADYVSPDQSYFQSNKDIQDINTTGPGTTPSSVWGCKSENNVLPKDELLNSYAARGTASNGDTFLYVGSERSSANGSAFTGVWFLQQSVTCDPATGLFVGSPHTPWVCKPGPFSPANCTSTALTGGQTGDILMLINYSGGGSAATALAYLWMGDSNGNSSSNTVPAPGAGDGPLQLANPSLTTPTDCVNASTGAVICGTTNCQYTGSVGNMTCPKTSSTLDNQRPPWNCSTTPPCTLTTGEFFEGMIDLSFFFSVGTQKTVPCFGGVLTETRSSPQTSATLKDFTLGTFQHCVAGISTQLGTGTAPNCTVVATKETVLAGASACDRATVSTSGSTITASGSVTYNVYTNTGSPPLADGTCSGTLATSGTKTLNGDGSVPPFFFTAPSTPGSYDVQAVYSGDSTYPKSISGCTDEVLTVISDSTVVAKTATVTITLAYSETNNGTSTLSSPGVSDAACGRNGGAVTQIMGTGAVTNPPSTTVADTNHNAGDTNNNGNLDPGETWKFQCTVSTTPATLVQIMGSFTATGGSSTITSTGTLASACTGTNPVNCSSAATGTGTDQLGNTVTGGPSCTASSTTLCQTDEHTTITVSVGGTP